MVVLQVFDNMSNRQRGHILLHAENALDGVSNPEHHLFAPFDLLHLGSFFKSVFFGFYDHFFVLDLG